MVHRHKDSCYIPLNLFKVYYIIALLFCKFWRTETVECCWHRLFQCIVVVQVISMKSRQWTNMNYHSNHKCNSTCWQFICMDYFMPNTLQNFQLWVAIFISCINVWYSTNQYSVSWMLLFLFIIMLCSNIYIFLTFRMCMIFIGLN
jgi:hypothetical protein